MHGVAVIGMRDQWLRTADADPLSKPETADQICCNGRVLWLGNVRGRHLAAARVDHQLEVQTEQGTVIGR